MADQHAIPIPLTMPPDEAAALAKLATRIDRDTVGRFAAVDAVYSRGRCEAQAMWDGVTTLCGALAGAGFTAR